MQYLGSAYNKKVCTKTHMFKFTDSINMGFHFYVEQAMFFTVEK